VNLVATLTGLFTPGSHAPAWEGKLVLQRMMENSIHSPKGFQVAALHCGLKNGNKKDLAVVFSE